MTRNLIATASRALGIVRPTSARCRQSRATVCLERLEYRLSLSTYSAGAVLTPALNPQPLPPGRVAPAIKHAPLDLNPQPLPPGVMASQATQGQHIGYNAVQGQHIGTNIVGQHIGTNIVGQHIGTNVMGTKFTVE